MESQSVYLAGMKVLLVDDTTANIDVLRKVLATENYEIAVAPSGEVALKTAPLFLPDLILMDVMMPEMDGYEACAQLKNLPGFQDIPIIFVTAKAQTDDVLKGFSVGGVDYITKPFQYKEVLARVQTHLRIRALTKERDGLIENLTEANRKLDLSSRTDPLTGLSNRRDLNQKVDEELKRYQRSGNKFTLIISDIDHFKNFNDQHGHDAGDFVLKKVAKLLQSNLRAIDTVGRWGGEEFLIISPDTKVAGAEKLAEKVRIAIESETFKYENKELSVTMSFGLSDFGKEKTIDSCLKEADDCLYKAKELGRNKVVSINSL